MFSIGVLWIKKLCSMKRRSAKNAYTPRRAPSFVRWLSMGWLLWTQWPRYSRARDRYFQQRMRSTSLSLSTGMGWISVGIARYKPLPGSRRAQATLRFERGRKLSRMSWRDNKERITTPAVSAARNPPVPPRGGRRRRCGNGAWLRRKAGRCRSGPGRRRARRSSRGGGL